MQALTTNTFFFGDFELDVAKRRLCKKGTNVPLNPKAFDLLQTLVENHDRILTKDELLDTVWANQFVEENNLTVHMTALRKALGEKKGEHRFIVTVPGKGYRFIGDVRNFSAEHDIVIESRKFQRIVVDEDASTAEENGLQHTGLLQSGSGFRWLWIVLPAIFVSTLAAWFVVFYGFGANSTSSSQFVATTFATTGGIPTRVAISPDGKTLAYSRRLKGKDSIWLGDIETHTSIQVTQDEERIYNSLEFSPDGRALFFTAWDESHPDWSLMTVSVFGGAVKDLVSHVRGGISVSPDGKEIVYFKKENESGQTALFIADASTGRNERIFYRPTEPSGFAINSVSWSPTKNVVTVGLSDGSGQNCNFTHIDPNNGTHERFGENLCSGVANFSWLKDGSGIAMTVRPANEVGSQQVWVVDVPSGVKRRITNDAGVYGAQSLSVSETRRIAVLDVRSFTNISMLTSGKVGEFRQMLKGAGRSEGAHGLASTPDGKILYTVKMGDSRAIWEMDTDGTNPRELVAPKSGSGDKYVNITADNRYVVFGSDRSGSGEIWRANRDGSNLVPLTSGGGNSAPALTPDGVFVLFMSHREGRSNIWRIPVEGGEAIQLTTSGCSWPDVSPDGKAFVCATGTSTVGPKRKLAIYDLSGGETLRSFDAAFQSALYNRVRWSPDGRSIIYKHAIEGLWQQDLSGEKPAVVRDFENVRVFHFAFDGNGNLFYSGGTPMRQIVILEPST